ncbi:MAG: HNH endonuclease [Thermoplasmatales archaeon]|nr:MAG: HNH endonuclease [Thermoplasmatales archaeon]
MLLYQFEDLLWGKKKTRSTISKSIKNEVLVRQGYKCYKCRRTLPAVKHFHHKRPVSKGGKNTLANIIALCPNCHSKHHHKQRVRKADRKARKTKEPWDIDFKF